MGVLGIAFVIGSFSAASSFERVRAMATATRMRETAAAYADALVQTLSRGTVPSTAQQAVSELERTSTEIFLRRRPLRAALGIVNLLLGLGIAITAAGALRRRAWARGWLLQMAAAALAFELVQGVVGAVLDSEQARALGPATTTLVLSLHAAPTPAPLDPAELQAAFRWVFILPAILLAALKATFLGYLFLVLRRPAVRDYFGLAPEGAEKKE